MPNVLVDTGVWYAMFDRHDSAVDREGLERLALRIDAMSVVVPWPIAYETLRTKFVRKRLPLELFERKMKARNIQFVDDAPYRVKAFDLAIDSSLYKNRPLSMVDCVLRLLLDDASSRVRFLATFNIADFSDVCRNRRIEILGP
jgi:predicted nucleic acid-binding protein